MAPLSHATLAATLGSGVQYPLLLIACVVGGYLLLRRNTPVPTAQGFPPWGDTSVSAPHPPSTPFTAAPGAAPTRTVSHLGEYHCHARLPQSLRLLLSFDRRVEDAL